MGKSKIDKKKNVVLVDYDEDDSWPFLKALDSVSSTQWVLKKKVTNKLHGGVIKSLLRMMWYFIFPLTVVLHRKRYDKIVGWQQFYGLNFAFWCSLFHLKKVNDLTVMTFIYRKKSGFAGRLYHKYMSYIVRGKYIDRFICFSKEECGDYASMFGVDAGRFVFVPLGIAPVHEEGVVDDGYLFATGRSNRNYDFIVDTLADTDMRLIIACDSYTRRTLPGNIEILNNCYGLQTTTLMSQCHCVLIPLENLRMSSGHLVALQAMSMGKPVICTDSEGIKDYIVNGVNGMSVVNTPEAWVQALYKLQDAEFYKIMSRNAVSLFNERFTENAMFFCLSQIIN